MAVRELAIILRAKDLASKQIKGVGGNLKDLNSIAGRTGKGIGTSILNVAKLGAVAAGAGAGGLVVAVKAAADFESQLNTINTVAQVTPGQLDAIGTTLRKMARSSGQDLSDLTAAYYDLVSAGIKPGADATAVLAQAQTLAVGGLATTSETVDLLTSALNTYHMGAKDAAHVTDVFAGAIAAGKTTAADLAAVFAQVGPMAQASGIEIEELGAAFGTLTAAGVKPAAVATNLRGALVKLQKPTAIMLKLQKELGVDFAKMAKDKGLAFTYGVIRQAADKAHIPLAQVLGDVEAQQFALGVTGEAAKSYAKNLSDAQKKSGVAAEQAAERQKGLNFQLSKLKALAVDAAITIGSKLLPKLTPLAEKAVAFLEAHQPDIERLGDSIAGVFDKAAAFAQKIPWEAVGSGLRTAADWAGKLMDVFLKLPPEAQATIVALAGLNKLSGGAVSGIVGELGKGLIKGVLGMNAGVVNINAGVVNGAGGSPAAAAAGGSAIVGAAAVGVIILGVADAARQAFGLRDERQTIQQQTPGLSNAEALAVQLSKMTDLQRQQAMSHGAANEFLREHTTYLAALKAANDKIAANSAPSYLTDETSRMVHATERAEAITAQKIGAMTANDKVTAARQATQLAQIRDKAEGNRIATAAAAGRTAAAIAAAQSGIRGATTAAGALAARASAAAGTRAKEGGLAAAAAINRKDLSVRVQNTIPITLIARVSSRENSTVQTTYKKGYVTAS